jgi:FkbM family methyltransferase
MYSQNDEETTILEVFKNLPPGRFLDIGAYDGKTFSNTLRLVELGWRGVCIEPSPNSFDALLRLHGGKDQIELVNCAVGTGNSLIEFFDSGGDAVSSSDPAHVERWTRDGHVKFKKFWLQTVTIDQILHTFGTDFDFINLDVESLNWTIFKDLPFEKLTRTKCICVEHDGHHEAMSKIADSFNFTRCGFNGENVIFHR